jgi:hypothetical protein
MDELTIGDKIYISSKQAAKITGYAKDYVGQLCREGRVEAKLVGRNWYVLESSIRVHRFGPESKPETVVAPVEPPAQPITRQWEASTYVSVEPEVLIPTITPQQKPQPAPETTEAVALMQDAWKEWFAAREQSGLNQEVVEEGVPEPKEEERIPEEVTTEEVRASDISSIYNVSEVSHTREEEEVIVPLTRVIEDEVEEYEPAVPLHVVRPAISSYNEPRSARGVVDLSHAYEEHYAPQEPVQRMRRGRVQRRGQGTLTMQAVFVSMAGLAIVVAVIGSGALDSITSVRGINDSLRGAIFDTLRGETEVRK